MRCLSCNYDNPADALFCMKCGAKVENRCPACNTVNPADANFCRKCGRARESGAPDGSASSTPAPKTAHVEFSQGRQTAERLEGERKTVTALFADIKGSTELMADLDPEEARAIVDPALKLMIDAVHRYDGYVVQSTGDGIFALFGAPVAHEDHPQRALYAGLRMQEELSRYSAKVVADGGMPIEARIGVNTGEVVVRSIMTGDGHTEYTPIGHTANLASRMQAVAPTRSIAISEQTRKFVEGYFELRALGPTKVKGVSEPVNVFEVTGLGALRSRLEAARARGFSRFVGRAGDMEALDAALAQAQAGNGQVVGIVAEAGTGKSRLCFEFLERCRARGLTVQVGRAVAHGKNIPFVPMLEAFRNYFGITDADPDRAVREKIAGRLLLTDESFRELLPVVFEFFGVTDPERPPPRMDPEAKQRQLFAALRKEVREGNVASQLVTLIEDLHWMDAGSEAFLDQWVEAIAGSRALLLVTFRPEYHSAWSSKSYYRQIPLAPLGAEAVRELLDDLLGADASITGLAKTIYERTGGNPFFTEEVVQSLIESGVLEGTRGSYRLLRPVERLQVPPTVQAVLAARIDRLGQREKQVLQTAAVIGKDFAEPILRRVVGETGRSLLSEADLRAALRNLKNAEFIYGQALYPVAEYAFKHPLTQEVALRSQLQERRRLVHASVARALEEAQAERLDETAALLAHHHEQAGEALSAARWHRRAAEWVGLSDIKAALHHWQRVRELARQVGDGAEAAALTAVACSQVLNHEWRMGASATQVAELFEEGCAAAQRAGDLAALAVLNSIYGVLRGFNQGIAPDQVRYASEAVRIADRTGDAALRCATRMSLMFGHMWCGQPRQAERVAGQIIELAREDPDLGTTYLGGISPLLAARGFRPLCIGYTRDPATLLRELPLVRQFALDRGYPEQALWMVAWAALLKSALGSSDGIRALAQAAVRLAENLGVGNEIMAALAQCAALASEREWQAFLDAASHALGLIRERGAPRMYEPVCLAHIGTAQLELGNLVAGRAAAEEGVAFMRESKGEWSPRSYAVLARAPLELGEPAAAIASTLDEYAALLERTELHLFEGELHELRARLADREGNPVEQAADLQRAYDCYTRFGMTAQAVRVKEAIG